MTSSFRLMGALALAGGVACAAASAIPLLSHVTIVSAAQAEDDPVLLYRDPMGGPEVSRTPKKDGMGMDFLPVRRSAVVALNAKLPAPSRSAEAPLFWRDAMGGTEISLSPKKDSMGMDFLPVRAADLAAVLPPLNTSPEPSKKRILYYRNPMGLADVSPVPKKDAMGMDYRPVYEGEDDDSSSVHIAAGKVQRTGVRTEAATTRSIVSKIIVPGVIQLDERRITLVSTRSTTFIEKVAEVTTGDQVRKGQVLFRFYSPEIASAAAQYFSNPGFEGARKRLDVLDVPAEFIAEIDRSRKIPLSLEWRSPRDGVVFERNAYEGMRADPGQQLFKIVDMTSVWALVDVAERDYMRIKIGQKVAVQPRGMAGRSFSGVVTLVYPQINKETRTVRIRVELQNPDLLLKPDMYVDAEIAAGEGGKVVTVPDSAVIDSGAKQLVLIDRGEGRFEPRAVRTGRRGEGSVEIREGVAEGDKVVTSANFLIDAESNLKAALKGLTMGEAK
ncbi:Cu(I)/Ag(I) efflux system membrane fusion protein [Rhodoblastus acidophilus]|uniref:efflux RND transporter periplasmic adaptor subunit n=1 Tax=Rhodoblastus acidophilus TaxID=1074 RepID=UPI0022251B74|nr:efflux RND transporter periplasmic adaptor subunit [Rhodoblastus acidophilus]MCW2319149.1 Cu(I)/Ag(I) efflux system membrane fusion protein [Rhodoblastus acidophilus]